jgi:mannose-6-phosphate isomerase-like protein (cupin superfamily)
MQPRTPTGLPRTVVNPVLGAEVVFLQASDETGGDFVQARVRIGAGDKGPPPHLHTDFEETFTVVEGTLHMDLGDRRGLRLTAGESVHVPRGVRHRYYNPGDREATFHFVARPGTAYEMGIRAGFGLAADGLTTATGVPRNPLDAALMFVLAGSYVAGLPLRLQKALAGVGARLAVLRGHDPTFSRYTRPTGTPPRGRGDRPERDRHAHPQPDARHAPDEIVPVP